MPGKPQPTGWRRTVAELGPGLGGIGSLLVGVAAVLAIFVANQGAGNSAGPGNTFPTLAPSQAQASVEPEPSAARSEEGSSGPTTRPSGTAVVGPTAPPFGSLLFLNDLARPVPGMFVGTIFGCTNAFDGGYSIKSATQYQLCPGSLGDADPDTRRVRDVRVQVGIEFGEFTEDPADTFGPGDAGIWCRNVGTMLTGDYYIGTLGPAGYWAIVRFEDGQEETVDSGIDPTLKTAAHVSRQLRLDCWGEEGAATTLRFFVDGRELGSYVDPKGLAMGETGVATTNFSRTQPMQATFRDLAVFGVN